MSDTKRSLQRPEVKTIRTPKEFWGLEDALDEMLELGIQPRNRDIVKIGKLSNK